MTPPVSGQVVLAIAAAKSRRRPRGPLKFGRRRWLAQDEQYLIENYHGPETNMEPIADHLHRTKKAVQTRRDILVAEGRIVEPDRGVAPTPVTMPAPARAPAPALPAPTTSRWYQIEIATEGDVGGDAAEAHLVAMLRTQFVTSTTQFGTTTAHVVRMSRAGAA